MTGHYHVQDDSILVPPLKRFVWGPLVPLIPASVSANSLTLLGTAMSGVAFGIAVCVPPTPLSMTLIAALIFGYLVLDNVDGAHARRTGTSSPLGEFLDHWLDALNLAFLFLGCIHTFHIPDGRAVFVMGTAVLSYTLTFWEQRVTGRMHMARVGNVEGIVLVILFYVAGALFGVEALTTTKLFWNQTVIDLFWYSAVLSTTTTSLGPVLRVRRRLMDVVEIVAPVAAVWLWYRFGSIAAHPACNLLMLLSPALAGRMLIARVTDQDSLGPDRFLQIATITGAIVSLAFGLSANVQLVALGLVTVYAGVQVGLDFVMTVRRLGDYLRPGELLAFARFWPPS